MNIYPGEGICWMKRADERDTIFARMTYEKGSSRNKDYYSSRKELEKIDDELRKIGNFPSPAVANFKFLADIRPFADGESAPKRIKVDPADMTRKIKALAHYYGADVTGIAGLTEKHYYSHRGRPASEYGKEVREILPMGIVTGIRMDMDVIDTAPSPPVVVESSKSYVKAAVTGMMISYYLRELGYRARNHMDGNYLLVAGRAAADAGLGEFGRCGMLVNPDHGPAVRYSVVSTDIPLIADNPVSFGLKEFCRECHNCDRYCPVSAISSDEEPEKWKVDAEKCYRWWGQAGSDCSLCIKACPFSWGIGREDLSLISKDKSKIHEILDEFNKNFQKRSEKQNPEWF